MPPGDPVLAQHGALLHAVLFAPELQNGPDSCGQNPRVAFPSPSAQRLGHLLWGVLFSLSLSVLLALTLIPGTLFRFYFTS